MQPIAIVLDGELKSALAAVRSLDKAGIKVVVGGIRSTAVALQSRHATHSFVYPSPKADKVSFLVSIKARIERYQKETGQAPVLLCFSDATHVAVAESIDTFEGNVRFPMPSFASFKVAFDKNKTTELAARQGIATIATHSIENISTLRYPVVVKPSKSLTWVENGGVSLTADFAFDAEELEQKYRALEVKTGEAPIIQSFVKGEEYGVEMLCVDGEVLALFAHQRIRSLSPSGGASVVKQTAPLFHLTAAMCEQSMQLAKALVWTGPIMVEWKVEPIADRPLLMEINGRFWGSLPLAVEAGVDFPFLYYQLARGNRISLPENFTPTDVRTRHFWGDVKWLLGVLFDRTKLRPVLYPSRTKALYFFFMEFFRSRGDIWAGDDSWPAFVEIIDIIKR